ncbi:MAG: recombination mediator RecR [Proteobacteria bacterium]|nr:recombination mediator RecR [Pseudomonadota bacterium]
MNHYPRSVLSLIDSFAKLPGIGKKTAERLTLHVLRAPRKEAEQLARNILELKDKMRLCSCCFSLSEEDVCAICSHPSRSRQIICVVERPSDMAAIEKSGAYKGLYHILQGVLSPMDNMGPDDIRIHELLSRVASGGVTEVILATSTNVEGESTAHYISKKLKPFPIKVTRIASGVPIGGDLKYVDPVTLKRAMEARRDT